MTPNSAVKAFPSPLAESIPDFSTAFAAFDRRLDPASDAPVVIALSGGGDSVALLHLALAWGRRWGRGVLALTVDHGLHSQSARWTMEAGDQALRLGAQWRALAWEGEKPSTGLPAAARQARHALLAVAARQTGARVVLMGHTAGDMAEGNVMRGDIPGLGVLREWSPSPVWPAGRNVFIHRPLLATSRADLRSFLRARGEGWLDDPANDDPRHPRVRARNALDALAPLAPAPDLAGGVHDLAKTVSVGAQGSMQAPRSAFGRAADPDARHVLSAALLCVAGSSRPPRGEPLRRLLSWVAGGKPGVLTLAGCRIDLADDEVRIVRHPPRRGAVPPPEEPARWIADRFAAACGLVSCEAEARAPSPIMR